MAAKKSDEQAFEQKADGDEKRAEQGSGQDFGPLFLGEVAGQGTFEILGKNRQRGKSQQGDDQRFELPEEFPEKAATAGFSFTERSKDEVEGKKERSEQCHHSHPEDG